MALTILIFGRLAEITGHEQLDWRYVPDTETLGEELKRKFPALSGMEFLVAVDKQVTTGNTILRETSTIALLPPFSGG